MIIGSGIVAKSLWYYQKNPNLLIFASGVSNSKEKKKSAFNREKKLLFNSLNENPNKTLVYFSSCSIYDNSIDTYPYIKHKIEMENLVQEKAKSYMIFRVSNLVGSLTNKQTIINYFFFNILNDNYITIWSNAFRNLLDIDDFSLLVKKCVEQKKFNGKIINLASPNNLSVPIILEEIENFLQKKAKKNISPFGNNFHIDTTNIEPYHNLLNLHAKSPIIYLRFLLNKYYSNFILS